MNKPGSRLGKGAANREYRVLKAIFKADKRTLTYVELEAKFLGGGPFSKVCLLDAAIWQLVEDNLIMDNFSKLEDSYSITSKGKEVIHYYQTFEHG